MKYQDKPVHILYDHCFKKLFLGPLLVERNGRYVIAGVTSWGYDCGAQGYPGVYARVTAQLDWIHDSIGGNRTLCEVDDSDAKCIQDDSPLF